MGISAIGSRGKVQRCTGLRLVMPALHDCGTELNPCQGFGGSDHATIKTWFLGQNQESVSVDF